MTVRSFLWMIRYYVLGGGAAFACSTLVAALTDQSFLGLDFLWIAADLREEGNLATWFESTFMLLCGLSFATVYWSGRIRARSRLASSVCGLAAFGCVFLSADEAATLHETLGRKVEQTTHLLEGTPVSGYGYSWLLLYAPVMLVVAVALFLLLRPLRDVLPERSLQVRADAYLVLATVGVPMLLVLELTEAMLGVRGIGAALLTTFEECVELMILSMFYLYTMTIGHYVR